MYYASGSCVSCPSGLTTAATGMSSAADCTVCESWVCVHGSCSVDEGQLVCSCSMGYSGKHCEVDNLFGFVFVFVCV